MNEQETYIDPILEKIFSILKENMDAETVKTFYQGDPLFIPKSQIPAILGSKDVTNIIDVSNAEDEHLINIILTVVIDIRDYVESDMSDVHVADQQLYNMVEGRNADYTLKINSIMGILRANEDLGNNAHINTQAPMQANYGFTIGKRGERTWACEAYITVPVYFSQLR